MIRRVTPADMPSVFALAPERQEELDYGPATLGAAVVLSDDMMVAYGKIQLFAELVIATNKSASTLTRARAIEDLMRMAVQECKDRPIDDLHAYAADPTFADFLEKHIGFQAVPAKALTFRLR